MHKYGKIFNLGHKLNQGILSAGKLVVTEKVDGANFRFAVGGPPGGTMSQQIVYGTRRKDLGLFEDISDTPCKKCQRHNIEKCYHTFYFVAKWVEENVDVGELEYGFTYFGEAGIKHTLSYENMPPFTGIDIWVEGGELGFDRFDKEGYLAGGRFVEWQYAKKIFDRLGIPVVPTLWEGNASEWAGKPRDLETLIGPSYFGDVKMEGIALKNYTAVNEKGNQLRAKIKREEFLEMSKATFGTKPKGMPLSLEVAEMFCNEVRIDKAIDILTLEDGLALDMKLMKRLFKLVGDDILQEEILTIAQMSRQSGEFDFHAFYGITAKKCAKRLQEFMVEEMARVEATKDFKPL